MAETENYAFIGKTLLSAYKLLHHLNTHSLTPKSGIGAMGYAMASNIRRKMPQTSTLYINDINASACQRFQAELSTHGPIEIVSTAREAAENAKYLVSIVPDAPDVRKVYLDEENGVIAARPDQDRIICECSTIDVKTTREVGEKLMQRGLGLYVDAPVSVRPTSFSQETACITDILPRAASPPPNAAT
jgi:3-hydroxyisobutyrate dehydrogenase-like beta-hydroxyacid dehydrogenase